MGQESLPRLARAFRVTQDELKISNAALEKVTSVHRNAISGYRSDGSRVSIQTLEKLLEGMESLHPGALRKYASVLAAIDAEALDLSAMSNDQLTELLNAIGNEYTKRATSNRRQPAAA